MLSLIHMLAARACHADTLRRALTGDDDARRLLSLLGVTPLDLQAIDHGRITRRKAALNEQEESTADAIDRALLWMSTTPPDALSKMDAHYKALLEQSTARFQEKEDLIRQVEHILMIAGDHEALPDQVRALAREHDDIAERLDQVVSILGCGDHDDVPHTLHEMKARESAVRVALRINGNFPVDAIKKLQASVESAEASVTELRQRLQAEIMAHDATRLRADLAEAASEHGPLTDIATLTGLPVQVVYQPTAPEEYRFSVHVLGYEGVAGPTPRQALLKMREKVVEGIGGVAKPALESDPLTDLLVTTRRVVRAFHLSKAPEECRFGVGIESYLHTHGSTPHEALSRMRDQVEGRLTGVDE